MDLVPDVGGRRRTVATEGEADVSGEGTMRGIPPGGEALLDGAGVHGAIDDGVVVVEPEALHLHWRLSWAVIKEHLGPIEPAKWAPIIMIHGLCKCGPCAC